MPAAFFDLDRTVIATSASLAFGRPFYRSGLVNRRAVLRSALARLVYLRRGADAQFMERMRRQLTALCTGWSVEQVTAIVEQTLDELIAPQVHAEAVALIAEHRAAGRDVVIVSSSGQEVVGPIGRMLGVDDVIATRMVVAQGRYTGDIEFFAYGEGKALAVRALAAERGYDLGACYAYSDSSTDLPMLEVVGHPCAVNPDRALRRTAVERGWPVLSFRRPVRLRLRRRRPVPSTGGPGPGQAGAELAKGRDGVAQLTRGS